MFIDLMGVRIRYEIYGTGDKKLCLLHGWGGDVNSFAPLVRDLSAGYQMLALDFPGHGQSGIPEAAWSVNEYMEATAALIEQTGFGGCGIIAHSFGGRVAILLAAHRPELVGRMLLTGAAGIPPKLTPEKESRARKAAFFKKIISMPAIPDGLRSRVTEALIQRYGSTDYKALVPSMRDTFNRVIEQDLTEELSHIRTAVFLFWGENDTETPLWMGKLMEEQIPDAALKVLPGCGHFAYLERSDEFRRIAEALFAG